MCVLSYGFEHVSGVWFVGFSPEKAKQLNDFANDKQPVVLKKCCIKNARSGNQLEILVGDYTDISKSAKKLRLWLPGGFPLIKDNVTCMVVVIHVTTSCNY